MFFQQTVKWRAFDGLPEAYTKAFIKLIKLAAFISPFEKTG